MENKSEEKIEEKIQLIQVEDEPKVEEHYKLYGLQVNRKETNRFVKLKAGLVLTVVKIATSK